MSLLLLTGTAWFLEEEREGETEQIPGNVLNLQTKEEFSRLTPLTYGTASGSDRMPASNVLLKIF